MPRRIYICSAILLISLSLIVAPALGISTTATSGTNAGKATSTTTKCDLDNSAHFHENTVGSCGAIYQNSEISGTGENCMEKTASGNGYSVMSSFGASGSVNSKTSTAAFSEGAAMNSHTSISGTAGCISSASSSDTNYMEVSGGFSGEGGDIRSDLTSATFNDESAYTGGSVSMLGVECLNEGSSKGLASGKDVGMSVNGLYLKPDGDLGDFGILAVNEERHGNKGPGKPTPDPSQEYVLLGYRWAEDRDIVIYLRDDYIDSEGLEAGEVVASISGAAETWNGETDEDLFNNVVRDNYYSTDSPDGKNVHAWKEIGGGGLAYARTYYDKSSLVEGYWEAVESDVCYNTNYQWSTSLTIGDDYVDGAQLDVQTVALHELGHTFGLGDLYKTRYKFDYSQIMTYYNDVQHDLGDGDRYGIQQLYGVPQP